MLVGKNKGTGVFDWVVDSRFRVEGLAEPKSGDGFEGCAAEP